MKNYYPFFILLYASMAGDSGFEPLTCWSGPAALPIELIPNILAGGERIELPPTESKSVELTVIRTPHYLLKEIIFNGYTLMFFKIMKFSMTIST